MSGIRILFDLRSIVFHSIVYIAKRTKYSFIDCHIPRFTYGRTVAVKNSVANFMKCERAKNELESLIKTRIYAKMKPIGAAYVKRK